MDVVEEAKEFLVSYLRGKEAVSDRRFPWKETWEYIVRHSFRVESYTVELIGEIGGISEDDALLIRTAAVLHDIGSIDDRKNHPKAGANIVKVWAANKKKISAVFDPKDLYKLIAGHQKKDPREKDIRMAVLCDADILDGIGAMSVFRAVHKASPEDGDYPRQIVTLIDSERNGMLKKKRNKLVTKPAMSIFDGKAGFVDDFYRQLKEELRGTELLSI